MKKVALAVSHILGVKKKPHNLGAQCVKMEDSTDSTPANGIIY